MSAAAASVRGEPKGRGGFRATENRPKLRVVSPSFTQTDSAIPCGLVGANALLEMLWPDQRSRPKLRWLKKMQQLKVIPVVKIGGRVWYEPERVLAHIRQHFRC